MITHCPSCHTHFRVHAGQLAARAGQVRCGKCARVFDALEHLVEEVAPTRAPDSTSGFDAMRVDTAWVDRVLEPAAMETEKVSGQARRHIIGETAGARPEPPDRETEMLDETTLEPTMSEQASFDSEVGTGASSLNFGPTVPVESAIPKRRWPWLTGALLLLMTLLAQAAYLYRGAIVLLFPETKPYAAALCANLGCDLPLPRRIELMSIEASDLQADTSNPNVMVLSATIKSRAIFNQQYPLLELTLTDVQDQPVVRRVLAPQDYLGRTVSIQDGFGANAEIAIKVFIEGSQVKATGYRLYLFYP